MNKKYSREMLNTMSRNPSNWKGVFYFNRKDPRIFVPKLNPAMGSTVNFANPYTYLIIGGLILVLLILKHLNS